jgi:tight adherence protein C
MTVVLFAVAIALVGATVHLLARAVLLPRLRLRSHLREIGDYGFVTHYEEVDLQLGERLRRVRRRWATTTGRWLMRRLPALTPLSAKELTAAGLYDLEPELVHGLRAFAALALPAVFLGLFVATGAFSALGVLALVAALLAGWVGPSALIRRRGTARLREIDRRLPELIDLLIATVEAGMGLAASLSLAAERLRGPLGDELRLSMRQQSLGMSIIAALDELVERCDTSSVRAFVRTAVRGETLGTSIGPVLRELSLDQRRRARMRARETMQKAPVKLIFPLMFFIMPALMLVLFFPAAYNVAHSLHGVL